ncbi:MAG: 50S ribosomal protein L19 [Bacteroidota bacterium]
MDAIKFVQDQVSRETDYPSFRSGDNVVVNYKIIEGAKERIQSFRGDVIKINGEGATKTFTVRKMSNGIGVERIFPYASPNIDSIKVLKRGKVRRAKLYYLRDLVGKKARIKERKFVKSNS